MKSYMIAIKMLQQSDTKLYMDGVHACNESSNYESTSRLVIINTDLSWQTLAYVLLQLK